MSAEKELARAAWLNEADAKAVMEALAAKGGTARFVGGCVRNALMGETVRDIDIATTETPESAKALLEANGLEDKLWVTGGNLPRQDHERLRALGFRGIFPSSSKLDDIVNFIRTQVQGATP